MIVPKTFVLSLTGLLVQSDYRMGVGYEIIKRPGMDWFLQRLSRIGEVVIFANEDLMVLYIRITFSSLTTYTSMWTPKSQFSQRCLAANQWCFTRADYIKYRCEPMHRTYHT